MALESEFVPLELDALHDKAAELKAQGWRFVQTHAVNAEEGVDLYYSFMKDGRIVNYVVSGVTPDQQVRSVSDLFLASFPFENEARELFGVNMSEIAIDFGGNMYTLAEPEPMTFISPEMKAEKDKQKKIALAKEAKLRKAKAAAAAKAAGGEGASEAKQESTAPAAAEKPAKAAPAAEAPASEKPASNTAAVRADAPQRAANAEEDTDRVISALQEHERRKKEKAEQIVQDIVDKARSEKAKEAGE